MASTESSLSTEFVEIVDTKDALERQINAKINFHEIQLHGGKKSICVKSLTIIAFLQTEFSRSFPVFILAKSSFLSLKSKSPIHA